MTLNSWKYSVNLKKEQSAVLKKNAYQNIENNPISLLNFPQAHASF